MAKLTRRRRLATATAAGALLATTLPFTAPANAAAPEKRDIESGCPSDRVPDRDFIDVDPGATHEFTINCIVWYDFARGKTSTQYEPGKNTTRGQMAGFLYRYLERAGVTLDDNAPDAFADTPGTFWETEINALAALDVVFGEPDADDFDGDGDTTEEVYLPATLMDRGRMAAFINNMHEVVTGERMTSTQDYFTDDNDSEFEADINALAENGIVQGTSTTEYSPDNTVFRGQMASFLAREADFLVDLGKLRVPVNGAADVVLDFMDVQQGRALEGYVHIAEGDAVASLVADGCSVVDETLTLDADNRFAVTIPLEQPATQCNLVFDVTLTDAQTESETKQITVTETDKFLAGPTLLSTEVVTNNGTNVTIRFEFDEQINTSAIQASAFVLHSFNGTDGFAGQSASPVSNNVVDVTWNASDFTNATTVSLSKFAVQDLDGNNNVEFSAGVQSLALTAGETSEPDLSSLSCSGANCTFTFDQDVFNVLDSSGDFEADNSTDASDFHLVLSNGTSVAGSEIAGSTNRTRTVTFTFEGATPVGGYVDSGRVSGQAEDPSPGTNPRQFVLIGAASAQAGPYLSGHLIDATSNSVQLTFNEAVGAVTCAGAPPIPPCSDSAPYVTLFDIFGDEYDATGLSDVEGVNNKVVATFDADTPWELIAGGTINAGIVDADRDSSLENTVGGFGEANSFEAGRTAAPDLISVTRSSSTNETGEVTEIRFTLKFDQAFDHVTDGNGTNVYLYNFAQSSLNLEGSCAVDDALFEMVCTVTGSDNLAFAVNGTYLGLTPGTVNENGDGTSRPNYATGAQVSTG